MQCRLCGNTTNNTPYQVREMMLGTRDTFNYFQCSACECLQIATIPTTMDRYYPNTYYSFSELGESSSGLLKKIRNKLLELRDLYAITGKGLLGHMLSVFRPFSELQALIPYGVTRTTSILDVGCGTGHYLYKLKQYGFSNLLGVDPYLKETIDYPNGLSIKKSELSEIQGSWDVIMLHHSLEHMEEQSKTLEKIASLLTKDGICLIRIPTVTSEPWEHYRENWVHLDPPRHFFLHSHKSLRMIAEHAGLSVISITSDSNAFSFYGSEFYLRDIPATQWTEEAFTPTERKAFAQHAKKINKSGRGDTIAVILKKQP